MNRKELEKYPIIDILRILTDLGTTLGDNDLLVQCEFYKKRYDLKLYLADSIFYSWVETVMERNNIEFIQRIRTIKLKKINQL